MKRRGPRLEPGPVFDSADENDAVEKLTSFAFRTSTTRGRFVLPRGAMGRITIFTSTSCGHCRRAKATLESRGFAYSEVSLSAHPERREDMTALASRVTVPQIFLNETHFGGNDQLERRVREDPDGFDEDVRRALAMPDPKDARLRASEPSGVASDDDDVTFLTPPRDASSASSAYGETSAPSHDRDMTAPDHFEATLALAKALRDRGAIRDRAKGARVHARCFDGAAFREATCAAFFAAEASLPTKSGTHASRLETNRDRIDRIVSARCACLLAAGTVVRVATDPSSVTLNSKVSDDEKESAAAFAAGDDGKANDENVFQNASLFRLRADADPGCVNDTRRVWPEGTDDPDPNATLERCMRVLARLEARHTEAVTPATGAPRLRVNRAALARDVTFLRVVDRLSFLKRVSLERFRNVSKTPKGCFPDAHLAAFLINAYNACVRVALTVVGVPASALARAMYFKRVGVRFRDGFYSLDDIEHGLLRGSAETNSLGGLLVSSLYRGLLGGQSARSRQIPPGDPRAAHVVRWGPPEASAETRDPARDSARISRDDKNDPRVHFALNCGARSCPPVSYYAGETLDRDLGLAATGFCEDDANVSARVSQTSNGATVLIVTVSALFRWYRGDFGANDREVLERVEAWCPPGSAKRRVLREALDRPSADSSRNNNSPFRMAYAPYDWSADATPESRTYALANVRASWGRLTLGFSF